MADDSDQPRNVLQGPWWGPNTCPSVLLFAAFLDGRLAESQHQRILDHLSECPKCRHDRTVAMALLLELATLDDSGLDEAIDEEGSALDRAAKEQCWALMTTLGGVRPPRASPSGGRDEGENRPSSRAPRAKVTAWRRTVRIALAAAGVAATLCTGSGFLLGTRSLVGTGRFASVPPSPRERPFVARFTGKLPWAAAVGSGHSAADYHLYLPPEAMRYLAAAERRGRPPEAPNAGMLGMVGTSQVLTGRVEPGVETLRRASAAQPHSAELLSDLGGALLARAEASERPGGDGVAGTGGEVRDADYAAALEAIERALEISPHLEEALFNRALALERLYLLRSARKAWQNYLDLDDSSAWADEARRRMSAIVIPFRVDAVLIRTEITAVAARGEGRRLEDLVFAHRQAARRTVQEELLPGWGEAWLSEDSDEASRQLRAATAIAEEWEAQTNDRSLREAIAEIESSTGDGRRRLAAGYRDLGRASRSFASFDLEDAQAAANRALEALSPTSSASTWAELVRLVCLFYRNGEIEEDARRIVNRASAEPAAVGRANWILGLWHAKRGNPATGLAILRKSLKAYEQIDEVESIAWLHYLVGEMYGYIGASDPGWRHRRFALEHADALTGSPGELAALVGSAMLALFEERPRAAADLLDEGLLAPNVDQPDQIALTYVWRSRVAIELGKSSEAKRDLELAAAWLSRAKPNERRYVAPDLDLAAGLLESDPHRAVGRISRSLERFREVGPPWRLPGVFLALGRAHLRAGAVREADVDLRHGLALLEKQETSIAADALFARRLDGPEELFDERIQLALRRGDFESALTVAEESRSRSLLALGAGGEQASAMIHVKNLRPNEIGERLEANTTLLFYSWLPDRVVLWRLARGSLSFVALDIEPADLEQLILAFSADLTAGAWTATTSETARQLYAALISPAKVESTRLVVVPDEALHEMPFGALINPGSGRFLIEESEVTVAPSANAFVSGQARWPARPRVASAALVIGDPTLDDDLFPAFRALEGARREARLVAALYARRELLLGGAATRGAVITALRDWPVVHFSGHALPNRMDPSQTSLPLASDRNGEEGLLVAADIARLNLTGTRTVILSGCETGVGEDGSAGPLSLAHAFLVAGVPSVVASLWPIADAPSAPLMTALHRRLRDGERPAEALRGAQLELLHGSEPILRSPSVWAGFAAFGS